MPNNHSTLQSLFSDIADAIRAKTGDSNQIVADDFPTAISEIFEDPEPTLPSTYQEVEYLICNGAEWIDTNLPMVAGDMISFKAEKESTSAQTIIGNRSSSTTRWDAGFENGAFYTINACYKIVSIVNENVWQALLAIYTETSTGFCYGAYKYTTRDPFYGKLYTLRIYRPQRETNGSASSSTLIAKFVPCYRKSDNVIGFYDVVNDVFYTNSGSGAFEKGNDVIT